MRVELIYDADCPNVPAARSQLIKAFARTGISARWQEWERSSSATPDYARAFGSPTILVDGKDIAGVAPSAGTRACRVYNDAHGGLSGTPSLAAIGAALFNAAPSKPPTAGRWRAMGASLPAVGTAMLPKLTCPLCFPAYAAILSALGIEFVDYTPYLLPLTALFLTIAMTVLVFQGRRTGNMMPLVLGIIASLLVLYGKFYLAADGLTTGGIILLVVAIFVGSRTQAAAIAACPACVAEEADQPVKTY